VTNEVSGPKTYTAAFLNLREELACVLGLQTVDLLIDRGLTEIAEAYPCLRDVRVQDGELATSSLEVAFEGCTDKETMEALNALTAVMLLIMARLLGKRVAESIAERVDKLALLRTIHL
jgi:hypothetical protein